MLEHSLNPAAGQKKASEPSKHTSGCRCPSSAGSILRKDPQALPSPRSIDSVYVNSNEVCVSVPKDTANQKGDRMLLPICRQTRQREVKADKGRGPQSYKKPR